MTFDELRAIVKRVTVRNPPFPIRLETDDPDWPPAGRWPGDVMWIAIKWEVPDRDGGGEITVRHFARVHTAMTEAEVLATMEERIRLVFEHEFAECFHVDGKRIHDPHGDAARVQVALTNFHRALLEMRNS